MTAPVNSATPLALLDAPAHGHGLTQDDFCALFQYLYVEAHWYARPPGADTLKVLHPAPASPAFSRSRPRVSPARSGNPTALNACLWIGYMVENPAEVYQVGTSRFNLFCRMADRAAPWYLVVIDRMGEWVANFVTAYPLGHREAVGVRNLFGVEPFLMLTLDNPQEVGEILRRLKDVAVVFAQAQFEAGADAVTLGDHATGDLVSGAMFRELLWPVHCELAARIAGPVILHICGNTTDRLADIAHTGFACFHFDSKVPAAMARRIVDDQGRGEGGRRRIALMGNINNPRTLLHGTPQDVAGEVEECLRQGIEIIGPECAVPLTAPTENLQAVAAAVRN